MLDEKPCGRGKQYGPPEIPDVKLVTKIPKLWFSRDVMVYENQGKGKDVVVIGFKPDELKPNHLISVYTRGKNRFLSSSNEISHLNNAIQISEYAHLKGLKGFWHRQKVQKESIRVNLGMDGPDVTYTLDSKPNDPNGVKAAKVLEDLDVKKTQIRFNPKEFNTPVIA